jgi:hypothetical protein
MKISNTTISSCSCCVSVNDVVSFMIWFNYTHISFLHSLRHSKVKSFSSKEMKSLSSKRMRRRIYLDFESKTWLVKKSKKVKKSSRIWLFMIKINVIYHYLSNDHYFIQFRFKLIKYDNSNSKSNNITYLLCDVSRS